MSTSDNSSPPDPGDRDKALRWVAERLAEAAAAGATVDYAALAAELEISLEEVEACAAAGKVLDEAAGKDHALATPAAASRTMPLPQLPGDYELLEEIGRGGMGVVYRARQRSLGRIVAVKVLRAGDLMFDEAVERFEREAQSLARLRHPHIVSVHEVGKAGGNVFYTMDFIEGASLAELIERRQVTTSRAVRLLRQVASAVAYTHSHGLIHRDLKPANILVDGAGDAFVVDFGLARDLGVERGLTYSGCVMGTPAYMSPEQARGDTRRIGEATDIYALGAILYECLAGQPPFGELPLAKMIHAVIHEEPKWPSHWNPRVPRDLEVICLEAMAKDPSRRYATARALLEDLESFEEGRAIRARPPSRAYRAAQAIRRNARLGVAVAIIAAFVALITVLVLRPFTGVTPDALVEAAADYHERGMHEEARLFFEQAKARRGRPANRAGKDGQPEALTVPERGEDLVERLYAGWTRCTREAAALLREKGRPGEALDILEGAMAEANAFFSRSGSQQYSALLMELACTQAQLGNQAEAREALASLRQSLEWGVGPRASGTAVSGKDAAFRVADDLLPKLLDAGDPCHEAAALYVLGVFESARDDPVPVARAVEQRGEKWIAVLLAAIRSLRIEMGERFLGDMYRALGRLVIEIDGPAFNAGLEAALAGGASEPEGSPLSRAMCTSLLALRADLPGPSLDPYLEFQPGLFEDGTLLSLWRALEEERLPRAERYRRKVAAAIDRLGNGIHGTDTWLLDHTGHDPGHLDDKEARRKGWRAWWEAHGAEDPRAWLEVALDRGKDPAKLELGEVVRTFASGISPRERAWRHHYLELGIEDRAVPPVWPSGFGGEPRGLAMKWVRMADAAGEPAFDAPHVLRAAYLQVDPCGPAPRLLWQAVRGLRVGEEVTLRDDPSSASGSVKPSRPQASRLEWNLGPPRPFTMEVTARLHLDERGLVLTADGEESLAGMVLPFRTPMNASSSHGPLLLAHVDSPGSGMEPWSIREWERKITENLEFLAGSRKDLAEGELGDFENRYFKSFYLLSLIAGVWPLPGARDAMRALHEGPRTWEHHRQEFLPGRLLAGDEAALSLDGLGKALDDLAPRGRLDSAYWARCLLASDSARLRDLAVSRLEAAEIPGQVGADLHSALGRSGAKVPGGLEERIQGARARLVREELYEWLPLVAVGLLWALFAYLALGSARPLEKRLRPAVILIVFFFFLPFITLRGPGSLAALEALPQAASALSGLLGSLVLARAAPGGAWRFLSAAGFGAVLALCVPLAAGVDSGLFGALFMLCYALSMLGLPLLVFTLGRHRAAVGFRPRDAWIDGILVLVFCSLPLAAAPLLKLANLGKGVYATIGLFGFISIVMAMQDLWKVTARRRPPRRPPAPRYHDGGQIPA